MRVLKYYPSMNKDDLIDTISGLEGSLILVKAEGVPILLIDGVGKRIPLFKSISETVSNVEVCLLEKWEFLELMENQPKPLNQKVSEGLSLNSAPKAVEFIQSVDVNGLPSAIALKIELSLPKIAKRAYSKGFSLASMKVTGELRHGATGRDILRLNVDISGYSTLSNPDLRDLKGLITEALRNETGFDVRVLVRGRIKRIYRLPLIKIPTMRSNFEVSGEVFEITLKKSKEDVPNKLDKRAIEREVEFLIKEAGIEDVARSLKQEEKRGWDEASIVKTLSGFLSRIKEVELLNLLLFKGEDELRVVIVVKKREKSASPRLKELVRDSLLRAGRELRAVGVLSPISKAYLVIK